MSALIASSASLSSAAARTARRASSSWMVGTPKTAITASPMNFSTVPPCRSRISRAAAKVRPRIRRIDSGSSRSPMAVEPVTSLNRMVTVLRVSRVAPAPLTGSGEPQLPQKRKPSGWPHRTNRRSPSGAVYAAAHRLLSGS